MGEFKFPIPVERLDGDKPMALACEGCEFTRQADPEADGNVFIEPEFHLFCPKCGGGLAWRYAEADYKCPACGKLGWWENVFGDGSCSRRCHLQAEHAKELAA